MWGGGGGGGLNYCQLLSLVMEHAGISLNIWLSYGLLLPDGDFIGHSNILEIVHDSPVCKASWVISKLSV